jgi:hypothetical protein
MFTPPALLSAVPTGVVDMTADFAPLFLGLVVGVCGGVLAFAIGVHDIRRAREAVRKSQECPARVPELVDAA